MWWNAMSVLQQTMFIIACAATAVLVIQIILMIIGGATDGGFDGDTGMSDIGGGGVSDIGDVDVGDVDISDIDGVGDVDTDIGGASAANIDGGSLVPFGLRLLSLRSILAFVAVGAWVCYTVCYSLAWYWAVIIAAACGLAAACGMAAALVGIEKMQDNGNIDPHNAVGKIGTVYLTIPPARTGRGKVNILIQERYAEYDAVTDGDEPIPTSSEIVVEDNAADNVLVVKKYRRPSISIETEKR